MLDEIKQSYQLAADTLVPGWRTKSKSELIKDYIQNEDDPKLKEGYISAILARYWNSLTKKYYKNQKSVRPEDCYDWIIDAVLYALNKKKWEEPDNKLHNDKNAPDKVVNRCIKSSEQGFYQFSNCNKRRVNYQTLSADKLYEEQGDYAFPLQEQSEYNETLNPIASVIRYLYKESDYFSCVVVDLIVNNDVMIYSNIDSEYKYSLSTRRLTHYLRNCNKDYFDLFKKRYSLDTDEMSRIMQSVKHFTSCRLTNWIKRTLNKLKTNPVIKEIRE